MVKYSNKYINGLVEKARSDLNLEDQERAKTELIEIFKPTIFQIIEKYRHGVVDYDDYLQSGILGLMMAITKYDKGLASFSTYSWFWIRKCVAEQKVFEKSVKISDYLHNQGYILEMVDNDKERSETKEVLPEMVREQVQDILRFLNKKLNNTEIAIFLAYYWDNQKLSDLSIKYKVQARSVIHKIMLMLRKKYIEEVVNLVEGEKY